MIRSELYLVERGPTMCQYIQSKSKAANDPQQSRKGLVIDGNVSLPTLTVRSIDIVPEIDTYAPESVCTSFGVIDETLIAPLPPQSFQVKLGPSEAVCDEMGKMMRKAKRVRRVRCSQDLRN